MKNFETLDITTTPAFFSNVPSPKVTKKYGHFNTKEILDFLDTEGWDPYSYGQKGHNKRTLDVSKVNSFSKHYAKFRLKDQTKPAIVGELVPELYLVNSHDGSSKLQIETGFMRLACLNGLIVRDSSFGRIDIKHSIKNIKDIKPMLNQFVDNFSNVANRVDALKAVNLSQDEQVYLAELASQIRWSNYIPKILVEKILAPRRKEDVGNDLWKVYNRIQENLVKGGLEGEGFKTTKDGSIRIIKTKQLRNIDVEINFNTRFWDLINTKLTVGEFVLN